jgi:hypothetical protein
MGMIDQSGAQQTKALAFPVDAERIRGHGVIKRGTEKVGEADYELMIVPPHLRGATFEPGNEPKLSPDITGRLLEDFYSAEALVDGVHTLVLEDGREFDFRVLQPETNEIIGVSWFRKDETR